MSRIRTGIPIYGLSGQQEVLGRMKINRSVLPVSLAMDRMVRHEVEARVIAELVL
jgi:hypothetical protein